MTTFNYTGGALSNLAGNTPGANVSNLVTLLNDLKIFINGTNIDATNLANGGVTAAKIEAQQVWQTIAFATGTWDSTVSYFKDSLGLVRIRGDVLTLTTGGVITAGTTLFTLPAGYRPVSTQKFPVIQVSTLIVATITAAGVVTLSGGLSNGNTLSFAGLTLRAEN